MNFTYNIIIHFNLQYLFCTNYHQHWELEPKKSYNIDFSCRSSYNYEHVY